MSDKNNDKNKSKDKGTREETFDGFKVTQTTGDNGTRARIRRTKDNGDNGK